MSDSADQNLGFRLVYGDGLQPGDRSIYHGGLWVVAVRDSKRRLDCVEVDFRDDDDHPDTFIIARSEMFPVIRTRSDGYEFDHQDDEPPLVFPRLRSDGDEPPVDHGDDRW